MSSELVEISSTQIDAIVGEVKARFNVAISRAKCLAILVAAPEIFEAECKMPRQMQLANAFCRYLEMAQT